MADPTPNPLPPATPAEALLDIYESAGFQVQTGWNSFHLNNWRDAAFTSLRKDGRPLDTGGGGLSWHEIPCLELISRRLAVERILIIGNSFGWSTLLISLLWPQAKVVAMDIGFQPPGDAAQKLLEGIISRIRGGQPPLNPKPTYGIELTNELAQRHGLKARAILSASPQDVDRVTAEHLGGPLDFVFIDGYHIPPQVILDFAACRKVASKNCVYLFHDVINWGLRGAFDQCQRESGLAGGILWRTASGMGLLFPKENLLMAKVFRAWADDEQTLEATKKSLPRWKLAAAIQRTVLHNRLLKKVKDLVIPPSKKS